MLGINNIQELDSQIKELKNEYNIIPILCFADTEENIKKSAKLKDLDFKLVINGNAFHEKFDIVTCPTTVVLDRTGHVIGYYIGSFSLEELLK